MKGSRIPIAVAHGEGRVEFIEQGNVSKAISCLRYVHPNGSVASTDAYPFNPNGSVDGLTGFTTPCGRVTIMMPHPERVVRGVANTWLHPSKNKMDDAPLMKMFYNARLWVESIV